ncbi:MAG: flagellar hook-length control protein FliK [Gammaproteobacteria bacterium]
MNTTPTLISPARAVDAKAGAARDSGSADTPFSQVLSDEMASQRNVRSERSQADKSAAAETPARSDPAGGTTTESAPLAAEAATAASVDAAAPADTAANDPLDPALQAVTPDPAALLGLATAPAAATALPRPGGAEPALDSASAEEIAHALAQPLDAAARQSRPQQQRADAQAGAAVPLRTDAGASGKAAAQPAVAAESAVQLAAARQPDVGGVTTESGFDQILHPALRAAAPLHEAAARLGAEAAQPRLAPPVGSNAWGQALGDKIVWMTSAAQQSATLTLNPPNLGPLQVVLNISNDQAVANFFAAQPEVRQALESAFPRLKEMLNEAGIQLEQATVSADASPQQQQETASGRQGQRTPGRMDEAATRAGEAPVPLPAQRTGRGLIDTFA